MTKQDKSDKGKGPALRPEADERIATPSTSSSTPLAPTQEDVIMDPQGTRETEQRETALTGERPNDRPKNDCNQEPASYNVFPAQSSSSRTATPPPTTFNPSAPNPFQSRTAAETYGFMSAAESRALTNTNTTASSSSSTPPRQPIFRPLAPNEFLFDPALSPRRRAAIVGGWVASDGSEAPEPEVVNQEMEPGVGWKKTHRGKRGGKKNRRGRGRGVYRGRVGKGGVGEEGEYYEEEEGGLDPEAKRFEPGCDSKGFRSYRRMEEPDDDAGMGAADGVS
ncbi:hypothetical protein HBH98_104350 [Parastagonospora nodorum]|nr:hypothetical protein HBH53_071290 [Parastagonospora nodorum]KAH4044561.1 hypothetical protein HBH49_216190 [Parastagonospora nodorum]KAH4121930.1 hypothetical protein HBH47_096460 [Parastagonospora nodorum]KAH4185966.1 hypothetical protein HBH42_170160 [Parastagonospora nodorum]KAH4346380.1 hypothetical protein HBH98_104350 [Parastagonospora nodorum]